MGRWARSETKHTRRPTRIQELLDIIYGFQPWMRFGACVSTGTNLWYPTNGGEKYTETGNDTALAKRICRTQCPVREQCLHFALRTEEEYGVWGGLSPRERARLLIRPLKKQGVSAAGKVLRTNRDEDPIMPDPDGQPICICTPKELEAEAYDPECPRHRKRPEYSSWSGPDDWS